MDELFAVNAEVAQATAKRIAAFVMSDGTPPAHFQIAQIRKETGSKEYTIMITLEVINILSEYTLREASPPIAGILADRVGRFLYQTRLQFAELSEPGP